jgi:hypothetical protein
MQKLNVTCRSTLPYPSYDDTSWKKKTNEIRLLHIDRMHLGSFFTSLRIEVLEDKHKEKKRLVDHWRKWIENQDHGVQTYNLFS